MIRSGIQARGNLRQAKDMWPWPTVAGGRQGRGAETGGWVNLVQATEGAETSVFSQTLTERDVGKEKPSVLDSLHQPATN